MNESPQSPHSSRSILNDQRGAIMIIGLGMAVFLVAVLYYVIGIGEAVLYRERLQDASDAAALSTALLHARGMNYIVFINLVMLALVAVLLILNVTMTLLKIAIVVLTTAAPFTFGSTAGLAALLGEVHQVVHTVYEPTETFVMRTLSVLHRVSDAVRLAIPAVATGTSLIEVNAHQQRPIRFTFAVPTRLTLPVEPDAFSVLCERAAGEVADFSTQALPDRARHLVRGAATGIALQASSWLCGAGDSAPPTYTQEQQYWYPMADGYESCVQSPEGSLSDATERERCERLRAEQQQSTPDGHGDCPIGADCSLEGPYEKMLAQAREQCKPEPQTQHNNYRWQQKTVVAQFQWTGAEWSMVERNEEEGRILPGSDSTESLAPCGGGLGAIGEDWRNQVHPSFDVTDVIPVCEEDYQEQLPNTTRLLRGAVYTVRYEAVTQVLGCSETKEHRVPVGVAGATSLGSNGAGKEPFRMEAGIELGQEAFQLRALAVAGGLSTVPEQVMKLAAAGRCNNDDCQGVGSVASELGRFSAAQAEYFYDHDGSEERSEWMWNMKWRARLVRLQPFESSSSVVAPDPVGACGALGSGDDCAQASSALTSLANLSVH